MVEVASKRVESGGRAPVITFNGSPRGLLIRIVIPHDRARKIEETVTTKARAKMKANRAVLVALQSIEEEQTRDRSGFLQANIPAQLKADLVEVARDTGTQVTSLLTNLLAKWINLGNGERRTRTNSKGDKVYVGPNYRQYVQEVEVIYTESVKGKSLARLQVEVGYKVVRRIDAILQQNRIKKGQFLTRLAKEIIDQHRPPAGSLSTSSPSA